jgi:hypothetical protein
VISNAPEKTPKRPPGRPREAPGTKLSFYVRTSDYDRIAKLALKEDRSLSSLVRALLHLKLE